MKRSLSLTVGLAFGLALSISAQTAPSASPKPAAKPEPAGPSKIAVIAFQVAVAQTNEGQRNFADIEKKYDPKRQQLKAMSDELDTLTKQLQAQGENLSDAERASRARTIDEKKKVFDREADDAKNDFQGAMQDMISGLSSKVYDVLVAFAQKQGYTLVLDEGQQGGPILVAAPPTTDITRAVIEAYNVKSGVPAPVRPASSAPGAQAKPPAPSAKP